MIRTVNDVQELENPLIPSRSRLYHLEPIGIGTPLVESLTSYLTRLAEMHCVFPKALVINEVLPVLGKEYKTRFDYFHMNQLWIRGAHSLNGTGSFACEWARALESLTQWNDLSSLTMLMWGGVIPQEGMLRRTKAWCSMCYDEWQKSNQVVYDPLLWAIGHITVCPLHRSRLRCRCPYDDCQNPLSFLAQQSYPGHCSQCRRWLGGFEVEEVNGEELTWQLWAANAVGELLAAAQVITNVPLKEGIAEAVAKCVEHLAGGNMSALARQLQIPVQLIWSWKNGQSLPRFNTLLQICYRLNILPFHFLTGNIEAVADSSDGTVQKFAPMPRKRRKLDKDEIKRALEAVIEDVTRPFPPFSQIARRLDRNPDVLQKNFPELCCNITERYQKQFGSDDLRSALETIVAANENPPPTLSEVGRRLGYQPEVLRKNFPDLCRAIVTQHRERFNLQMVQRKLEEIVQSDEVPFPSMAEVARRLDYKVSMLRWHFSSLCKRISARYGAYRKSCAQARKELIRDEVRRAVCEVHSHGKFPSARLVASLLTRPQDMLEQETVKAWHEALQELGLEA